MFGSCQGFFPRSFSRPMGCLPWYLSTATLLGLAMMHCYDRVSTANSPADASITIDVRCSFDRGKAAVDITSDP